MNFICRMNFTIEKDYIYTHPKLSDSERVAPHAVSNYHNLLISNLDSWKGWPRRNKSLIVSGYYRAENHADDTLHVVIPYDNAVFANCSRDDFWRSFPDISNLSTFITDLTKFLQTSLNLPKPSETNWNDYRYFLNRKISFNLIKDFNDKYYGINLKNYNEDLTLLENLSIMLEPIKNRFIKGDVIDTLNLYQKKEVESWTEDECLMVCWNALYTIDRKIFNYENI